MKYGFQLKSLVAITLVLSILSASNAQKNSSRSPSSWQYGHCLTEVHFGGDEGVNYIPIRKDDSSGNYTAPQLVKSHDNGCENSIGGTIIEQEPVAYVSGTKARVKAVFDTDCTHLYYIRGIGPNISTGQIIFPMQLVQPNNGQAIYNWRDASESFVNNKVKYFSKFKINWQLSEDGSSWTDIDYSENPLYVTHKAPMAEIPGDDYDGKQYQSGIGYEWFESLLYLSCSNAKNKVSKTDIFESIWNDFKDNQVTNSFEQELNYYYHWNLPFHSTNTGYLLQYRDGQCYSWCSLLIDLLKIQGINQSNDLILIDAPENEWFLIKDWNTLDNPFETFNTSSECEIENSFLYDNK